MKNLIAKTKVASVTDFGNNNKQTRLSAVTSGSEENKSFSSYTPSLTVEIMVNNPERVDFFIPGEEVYLMFSKEAFAADPESSVDENTLKLLERCYNHLLFPGRYNNKQLHNLKVAISMVLDERVNAHSITFELVPGGIQSTLADMKDGLTPSDYEDFACTEVGQQIKNGAYLYKRVR